MYKLDRESGEIRWTLGGKRSDFELGPGARFAWQHDVRAHPDGTLTIFDNGAEPAVEPRSRALRLELDHARMRASTVAAWTHPRNLLAHAMGNVQALAGGGALVGWGTAPAASEFGADGFVRWDASFPQGAISYRSYRFPWTGLPQTKPDAVRDGEHALRELERRHAGRGVARLAGRPRARAPAAARVRDGRPGRRRPRSAAGRRALRRRLDARVGVRLSEDRPVDETRIDELYAAERARFEAEHPRSRELAARARRSLLAGVPMHWMTRWAGGFPVYAADAHGARFTDVDGREYVDFCLGDTGAMTGHSPAPTVAAVRDRVGRGITLMLPSEDALWVGEELQRRFGLPFWQFALTATDANRFAIRLARAITGRPKILVHNWCYHGTVDETVATLEDGRVVPREGSLGPPVDPALTTRVVEFNDVEGLERELAAGDVACALVEPALTNIGIVLPEPGYHEALRRLTREHGTLLVVDETHTLCAGPGGYTRAHGLEPDLLTVGKAIAGGIPAAAYGFSEEVAARVDAAIPEHEADVGGVGGTLAANVLSLAAMRATLGEVLTDEAFARMIALGERFEAGVAGAIERHGLPWHVTRLGCRVEYLFRPERPRTGEEAAAGGDVGADRLAHLWALNRGILLTPFHNMALMSPATSEADVDRHSEVFDELAAALTR